MRIGRFRPVHAKSMGSQEVWALLVARKQLLGRLIDVELSIRGIQRAQFYSDWRATLNMATGEFSVGHVAEPFGNRIGRKMQIERLRWTAITAVQKRRRGAVACRIRVVVLRKFNQRIDRQGGVFTGLDHHIGDKPAIRSRGVGSVFRHCRRVFRPAGGVSAAALHEPALACSRFALQSRSAAARVRRT
jgi:hypothetical protein